MRKIFSPYTEKRTSLVDTEVDGSNPAAPNSTSQTAVPLSISYLNFARIKGVFVMFMKKMMSRCVSFVLVLAALVALCVPSAFAAGTVSPSHLPQVNARTNLSVLLVGNSYSVDSSEYLYEVAKEAGYEINVGNVYINGSTLEQQWSYVSENLPEYTYRKYNGSKWVSSSGKTLESALEDKEWDVIFFQQYSSLAGVEDSFAGEEGNYVTLFAQYAREHAPNAKIGWEMTWAYPKNSTADDFKKYFSKSQATMYQTICETTKTMIDRAGVDLIAQTGTAVQNARSSYLGDTLNRDNKHLSYDLGRYLAAMSIASACGLKLNNIQELNTEQETYSNLHLSLLKKCVSDAENHPYTVTQQSKTAPTLSKPAITLDGSNLCWKAVNGAVGYVIEQKKGGGKFSTLKTLSKDTQSFSLPDTENNTVYSYQVRAVGDAYISDTSSESVYVGQYSAPSKPTISSLTNTSKGITVTWKKGSDTEKYQVYRSTNGGSYTKVKTTTSTSWTDESANSNGTKYSYKVYALNGEKKSDPSAVKTTYYLSSVSLSSVTNAKGKKMTVKWKKNSKASGYELQYSTSSSFSNAKKVTVSSGSTVSKTISGLTKNKKYYVRVRSYKKSGNTKYYSAWSGSKNVKISK
jgi:hypothetical protein